jgi:hypothetical protein
MIFFDLRQWTDAGVHLLVMALYVCVVMLETMSQLRLAL